MITRGDIIEQYKNAFMKGTEGEVLLSTIKKVMELQIDDKTKALCWKEEIDNIICGYMESKND